MAKLPENRGKNRHADILPCFDSHWLAVIEILYVWIPWFILNFIFTPEIAIVDASIVKLKQIAGASWNTTYINASFLPVFKRMFLIPQRYLCVIKI